MRRYFEDFSLGEAWTSKSVVMSEEDIIRYAREYDPQPIHTDPEKAAQGRFGSVPMDEDHLESAVRYVSLNPVRAGLVKAARDWPWSSVRAHLAGADDGVVAVRPVLDRWPDFASMIAVEASGIEMNALRKAETSGRPLGSKGWMEELGVRKGKPGRRPR